MKRTTQSKLFRWTLATLAAILIVVGYLYFTHALFSVKQGTAPEVFTK